MSFGVRKKGSRLRSGLQANRTAGFSLIELVAVLVILGALAVVAVPRLSGGDAYQARGFLDETAAAARYAQRLATTSGCAVQFSVGAASGYSVQHQASCDTGPFVPVQHPASAKDFAASVPSGVSLSVTGDGVISFDALGTPSGQVTVSASGISRSFIIHSETGYVETL